MKSYLEAVRERVVIFDGATGTNLQRMELTADDFGGPQFEGCNELLVATRPDAIAQLHNSFFEVGSEVVETDSFGSLSYTLGEYGIAERAHELNLKAAQIAKEVASGFATSSEPRWVAGSIGPGTKFPSLGQIRFAALREATDIFLRQPFDDITPAEQSWAVLQQLVAALDDARDAAALPVVHLAQDAVAQDLGVRDDGREGRAQVVRDVRQELRLKRVARLQLRDEPRRSARTAVRRQRAGGRGRARAGALIQPKTSPFAPRRASDYNAVLRRIGSGRLFPTGAFRLLFAKSRLRTGRVMALGVVGMDCMAGIR